MEDTSKLMLTVVAGGVIAGAWLGQMSSPVMQFAAQPEWQAKFHDRLEPDFSTTPLQFVSASPEDLSPFGWSPGAMMAARSPTEVQPGPAHDADIDYSMIDEATIHDVTTQEAIDMAVATAQRLDDDIRRIEPPPLPATVREPVAAAPVPSL